MFHLAQINVGRFRVPVSDPANAFFVANLDRVNAIAEGKPGFVWRLQGENGNATELHPEGDPMLAVNMSVWENLETLAAFTYQEPAHRDIMRRRREWFERMEFFMTLWWVPAGHIPAIAEGMDRLALLQKRGPTQDAFTFRMPFPAPGEAFIEPVLDRCA
jgi:hypothetical protein